VAKMARFWPARIRKLLIYKDLGIVDTS